MTETLIYKLDTLAMNIEPYKDIARQDIDDLSQMASEIEKGYRDVMNENRLFTIAVIGQVKAGKSSFLNALLFKGKGVLPTAAQPMTAALTVIEYAEKCSAECTFYSKEEWKNLVNCADEYEKIYAEEEEKIMNMSQGNKNNPANTIKKPPKSMVEQRIDDSTKSAYSLVEAIKNQGIQINDYLDKTITLPERSTPEEMIGELQEYVGSNGKYALIVSSVKLRYNDERIKGYKIIDTPGLNDPVIIRTRVTKKMLSECDAVFFLSRTSSFLDRTDIDLLIKKLPSNGVKEISIIASRFDNEFAGEKEKYNSFKSLYDNNYNAIQNRVSSVFAQFDNSMLADGQKKTIELLKKASPIPVSSLAFMIAEHWDNLSEQEQNTLDDLKNLYPQESKTFSSPESLRELSCISRAHKTLDAILKNKEVIREERKLNYLLEKNPEILKNVKTLATLIEKNKNDLDSTSLEDLANAEKELSSKLHSGRNSIEEVFDNTICSIKTKLEMLKTELKEISVSHQNINVEKETETHREREQVSRGGFFGGIADLFSPKYETYTYTTTTYYANTHEAIDKVEAFSITVEKELKTAISQIIDLPLLKNNLLNKAMALFDLQNENFDSDLLIAPLRRAIQAITVPEVDFGNKDYTVNISSKFSGRVSDGRVDSLKEAQRNAIKEIITDLGFEVGKKKDSITDCLAKAQNTFIDSVTKNINDNLEQMRKNLADKKNTQKRMGELINILKKFSL